MPILVAREVTNVRDVRISKDGTIGWAGGTASRPDVIILAVGFGIERTIGGLPLRSYWRVDSLTQTPLDCLDKEYVVYVGGTGDGGIIDVLRATLKEFDHGVFLDECVLRLRGVQSRIKRIERELKDRIAAMTEEKKQRREIDWEMSTWLDGQYSDLKGLSALDELLDLDGEQIWPPPAVNFAVAAVAAMSFPEIAHGTGNPIGPGWELPEAQARFRAERAREREQEAKRCARMTKDQEDRVTVTNEKGSLPHRDGTMADAAIPEADSRPSGCDIHLSVVFPGIKGSAVAVGRDTEIAAIVDQQHAVDTEQALGGSRLNHLVGRDDADLRVCAHASGE